MERLILLRHGRAEPDSATGDDMDRRLEPRGVEDSVLMGHRLADMGFHPHKVLVSPSARTQETWEAAAPAFPFIEVEVQAELYNASAGEIRQAAQRAGLGKQTILVVGHNPGLQELVMQLLVEGDSPTTLIAKAARGFPPAAAAAFLIDANGKPAYDGLFYPD
jgi:phosphohistidine phosphatase